MVTVLNFLVGFALWRCVAYIIRRTLFRMGMD